MAGWVGGWVAGWAAVVDGAAAAASRWREEGLQPQQQQEERGSHGCGGRGLGGGREDWRWRAQLRVGPTTPEAAIVRRAGRGGRLGRSRPPRIGGEGGGVAAGRGRGRGEARRRWGSRGGVGGPPAHDAAGRRGGGARWARGGRWRTAATGRRPAAACSGVGQVLPARRRSAAGLAHADLAACRSVATRQRSMGPSAAEEPYVIALVARPPRGSRRHGWGGMCVGVAAAIRRPTIARHLTPFCIVACRYGWLPHYSLDGCAAGVTAPHGLGLSAAGLVPRRQAARSVFVSPRSAGAHGSHIWVSNTQWPPCLYCAGSEAACARCVQPLVFGDFLSQALLLGDCAPAKVPVPVRASGVALARSAQAAARHNLVCFVAARQSTQQPCLRLWRTRTGIPAAAQRGSAAEAGAEHALCTGHCAHGLRWWRSVNSTGHWLQVWAREFYAQRLCNGPCGLDVEWTAVQALATTYITDPREHAISALLSGEVMLMLKYCVAECGHEPRINAPVEFCKI